MDHAKIAYDLVMVALSVSLIVLGVVLFLACKKKPVESEETLPVKFCARAYPLMELDAATGGFNHRRIIGQGRLGTVYAATLSNAELVAVKMIHLFLVLSNASFGFSSVLKRLSLAQHPNVVPIIGFSEAPRERVVVMEFIRFGNLYEYLHGQNEELPMTWDMRLRIASEIAGALFYLHSAASQPIYHRDVKSTNILLDGKYRAKVADFGASRMISIEDTHLTTVVQGTFGYMDLEYFHTSQLTEKSDVYSFRVVLLELLTGQKPLSSLGSNEAKSLASYFVLFMEKDRMFDIIDDRVTKEGEKEHIIAVANLAYRCLELNEKSRPTMKEVTRELDEI
ncbi:wall-associated receptor kinase-like 1 [Arachis stenosperma]|uniref:wall-associated receptor kinase-like 1 n=1 Tax=Arachis stenosperma TaxID=217475 RepID=UPI0025AB8EB9|nr:wall-associated receptor kinase-like 1 [Arachis stenosperma]